MAAHGFAVCVEPHQFMAAARQHRRCGRLDGGGLLHRPARIPRPVGAGVCQRAGGVADFARHRHPHAPRPHWLGALAVRALGCGAVDERDGLQRGAHGLLARFGF